MQRSVMHERPNPIITEKQAAAFWSKVDRAGPNDCWPWNRRSAGRPEARAVNGKFFAAHIALALAGRVRPPGAAALHSCDNGLCCNERHLRWGTQTENMADRSARGRQAQGVRCHTAKLDPEKVRAIRSSRSTQSELARKYGVTAQAIAAILRGHTWRHVV
jgi:hypothetical protein